MKFSTNVIAYVLTALSFSASSGVIAFAPAPRPAMRQARSSPTNIFSMPSDERMAEIAREEASNEANMRAAAQQMKNLKPEDIEKMVEDMEKNPFAKQALKAMGMDPEAMKKTMKMMKGKAVEHLDST